jgi:hypothetical protein
MKPSKHRLGKEIQLFLIRHGWQVDDMARALSMTADGLSNLIHGRRRFRDDTLARISMLPLFSENAFTLERLKALGAMEEYRFEELLLAVAEYIQQGASERLSTAYLSKIAVSLRESIALDTGLGAGYPLSFPETGPSLEAN